ncbi:MAG: hypothetical protein LLG14_01300 [Nocardiaceae bacterium]|nr:hypothetical protein [Nocardiaceae bacterium]
MLAVAAFVWRGGFVYRAMIIGGAMGLAVGILGWMDSGVPRIGFLCFLIIFLVFGIWMPRRMARLWPTGTKLSGEDRVAVVRITRGGRRVVEPRLAQAVIDYSAGMHAEVAGHRWFRWLVPFVLVVGFGQAIVDAIFGSWGSGVASAIYLVALLLELFWWPKRRDVLVANGDRAAEFARLHIERESIGNSR